MEVARKWWRIMEDLRFDSTHKHKRLSEIIRNSIVSGEFKEGERLPSQNELSKTYGVSSATAREAVGLLVSESLLYRIQGKGTFVAPTKRNRRTIAVVIPHLYSNHDMRYSMGYDVATTLVHCIEDEAKQNSANLMLCLSNDSVERERENLLSALDAGVDGVVFFSLGLRSNVDCVERLIKADVPVVLIDTNLPGTNASYVGTDNFAGAKRVTEELIDAGFDRIVYLNTAHTDCSSVIDRHAGCEASCRQRGVSLETVCLPIGAGVLQVETEQIAYEYATRVLPGMDKPVALFAVSSSITVGLWRAVDNLPMDHRRVALGCFDELPMLIPDDVFLVKAIQPLEQIGRGAVQALISQTNGATEPLLMSLAPKIVVNCPVPGENKAVAANPALGHELVTTCGAESGGL